MNNGIEKDLNLSELQILQVIRDLKPYEKIEIKLKDNRKGEVVCTITSNIRIEYEL